MGKADATTIKNKIFQRLDREGISIKNGILPTLDSPLVRDKESVVRRAIILYAFKALTIYPEDLKKIANFLNTGGFRQFLSPNERTILGNERLSTADFVSLSWYSESLYVLLWYINIIKEDNLIFPFEEYIIAKKYLDTLPPEVEFNVFLDKIKLRDYNQLFEELYLYYYLHWFVKKKKAFSLLSITIRRREKTLNKSVIIERRKALEWLFDNSLNWDTISLDT